MFNVPHRNSEVKPHSFAWFSDACAAAIALRNHFFRLYQQNKSFLCKSKFRRANNHCKRVFEPTKLVYTNETKESSLFPEAITTPA